MNKVNITELRPGNVVRMLNTQGQYFMPAWNDIQVDSIWTTTNCHWGFRTTYVRLKRPHFTKEVFDNATQFRFGIEDWDVAYDPDKETPDFWFELLEEK